MATHLERGKASEDRACAFLQAQGLSLLTRNFSCRLGEIDLIMRDKETLVFIEVRYRVSDSHGGAAATVTLSKQRKLVKAAQVYLQTRSHYQDLPCRFDVLAMDGANRVEWIQDAFQL